MRVSAVLKGLSVRFSIQVSVLGWVRHTAPEVGKSLTKLQVHP